MSVTAKIILQSKEVSIAVPLQAIQRKGQEKFVQVLNDKNELVDKVVETGVSGTQLIEILSGISSGEEVVLGKASADGKLPVSEDPFREQRDQQRSNGGRNN
jgi:macrolide-specific efflux system membrane fusion protein